MGTKATDSRMGTKATDSLSLDVLWWVFAMCGIASIMVMINKFIFQAVPLPCLITCFQNFMTVLINIGASRAGVLTMKPWKLHHLRSFSVQGFLLALTLGMSNFALPKVATSTLIIFKSLTTILTSWTETALGLATFSVRAHIALATSFAGAVVYSLGDSYYDPVAYQLFFAVAIVNCCLSTYERLLGLQIDQTPTGCSCYKNLISLPFFLIFAVLTGEPAQLLTLLPQLTPVVCMAILATAVLGFLLSLCYSTLYRITAATTVLAASNVNKIVTSILGNPAFGEHTSPEAAGGIMLSLGGIIVYAFDKAGMDLMQPASLAVFAGCGFGVCVLVMV